MLARRLLLAGSGGSFEVPAAAFSLGVTGFWSNVPDPVAAHYNGKSYIGFVTDAGDVGVSVYDHASASVTATTTIASATTAPSGVIHNSPAVIVRSSDHRIVVAWSPETGASVVRISTNAEDISAFGAPITAIADLNNDYSSLAEVGGSIYLFTRPNPFGTGALSVVSSSDGGATWSSLSELVRPDSTATVYWRLVYDASWIHLFVTSTNRVDAASSVYHFKFDGTDLYKSDGTHIRAISAGFSVASDGTLVQNSSLGTARPEGCALDASGNPTVAILCYDTGAGYDLVRIGRWTGAAWSVNAVGNVGGLHTFKFNEGVAFLDASTALIPRLVGSYFEIHRARTTDGWATYSETQVTTSSGADNLEPFAVKDGAAGLQAIWGRGMLTSGSNFDFTIQGYGT